MSMAKIHYLKPNQPSIKGAKLLNSEGTKVVVIHKDKWRNKYKTALAIAIIEAIALMLLLSYN